MTHRPEMETAGSLATPRGGATRRRACFALLAVLVTWGGSASAQPCPNGGTSALPAPPVEFLRPYRASFRSAAHLAVDSQGRIYLADPAAGTVVVRAADGALLDRRGPLGRPVSLAVDAAGERLYVGDGEDGRVTAYGTGGAVLFDVGQGVGEFAFPADLALDPATGNLWVADGAEHRVKVYDGSGTPLFAFGEEGTAHGQLQYPAGIFVDGLRDEVLVADQVNGRLQIFDRDGNFKSCLGRKGSGPGRFNLPQGLWVDAAGRIYVADVFEGRVQIVDRQGALVAYLGEAGSGLGQLSAPVDLAVDPSGRLLVSSSSTARLDIFGLDGSADPERLVPAEVVLRPAVADLSVPGVQITAGIEVPFYDLGLLDLGSITANGVAASPGSAVIGDFDGDHEPDVVASFAVAQVAATLGAQGGTVRFSGQLAGLELEGFADLELTGEGPGDGGGEGDDDGDGIPNAGDLCPGTETGEPVDDGGCSLDQLCPCEGPAPGESWPNHGQYVACVATHIDDISHPPFDPMARRARIARAAKSDCGR